MVRRSDVQGEVVRIVFVCTGNRARSALAASLLRRYVSELPVIVESRGTLDVGAAPVLPAMLSVGSRLGLDLTAHRATALAPRELSDAALVLGFEATHVATAVVDGGARRDRTFTLPEFLDLASYDPLPETDVIRERLDLVTRRAHERRRALGTSSAEIADPYGAPASALEEISTEIGSLVAELVGTLFRPARASTTA